MSWGLELWDQYDSIGGYTQKGIEFCEKFTNFLKERSAVEQEYARALKKLVKSFQPKKKEEDEYQFTWARAFADMVKELHDLAGQHEVIAENLQTTVTRNLQTHISDLKQERKKHLQEGAKLQDNLRQSAQALDRSKKQYEKTFRDAEKAMDNYRKADADINLSRAEVEKYRMVMTQKADASEESKAEYASMLQQFNANQHLHFHTLMPQVFQQLQAMDEKRVNKVQECIHQCYDIENNVIPIINTCIQGMERASASINIAQDSKLVVDRHKSGFPMPTDVAFEDLSVPGGQPDSVNNKTHSPSVPALLKQKKRKMFRNLFPSSKPKAEEQKEDFSDLPPNQRKRKLQQKIDAIKKDLTKEQAERDGIMKLKDVYVSNPAMGDPSTLEKKVEESSHKVDCIKQELARFEGYLAECEGHQRRSSVSEDSVQSSDSGQQQQSALSPDTPHDINVYNDASDSEEEDFTHGDDFAVIGTCVALYDFEATSEEAVGMAEGEELEVLEEDKGDGWTRVRKSEGNEGFVPSSYVQCQYHDSHNL